MSNGRRTQELIDQSAELSEQGAELESQGIELAEQGDNIELQTADIEEIRQHLSSINSILTAANNNQAIDVNIQDQSTRAIFNPFCKAVTGPYTLASNSVPNAYTVTLTDATGLNAGDRIGLFQDSTTPASFFAKILSIDTNTLTLDTPIDIAFNSSIAVLFEILCNMNVNGSSTAQVFAIDNESETPIDITRIIMHITDETAMDDGEFGGLGAALTRGIVLRKKNADGSYVNYWNVKTNGEIGEITYDKQYDGSPPSGVYGLTARLTFAGQEKLGVVVRLLQDEELQMVVQDDLTGLVLFGVMAEGHFTDEV